MISFKQGAIPFGSLQYLFQTWAGEAMPVKFSLGLGVISNGQLNSVECNDTIAESFYFVNYGSSIKSLSNNLGNKNKTLCVSREIILQK